jgi:hypothetical protein
VTFRDHLTTALTALAAQPPHPTTDPELRRQLAAAIKALGASETELVGLRATVARVQAIAEEYPAGIDTALIWEALDDTHHPLTEAEEARLAQRGIHTPGCTCGHDGRSASWHDDDCPWRQAIIDRGATTHDTAPAGLHAQLAAAIRDCPARYPDDIATAVLPVVERETAQLRTERDMALRVAEVERGAIAQVRKVLDERRTEVAEREADGMLPFGTPGASWCDAVTVTCARVEDALRVLPPPGFIRSEPDHAAGPSVAECRDHDRAWDAEQEAP